MHTALRAAAFKRSALALTTSSPVDQAWPSPHMKLPRPEQGCLPGALAGMVHRPATGSMRGQSAAKLVAVSACTPRQCSRSLRRHAKRGLLCIASYSAGNGFGAVGPAPCWASAVISMRLQPGVRQSLTFNPA